MGGVEDLKCALIVRPMHMLNVRTCTNCTTSVSCIYGVINKTECALIVRPYALGHIKNLGVNFAFHSLAPQHLCIWPQSSFYGLMRKVVHLARLCVYLRFIIISINGVITALSVREKTFKYAIHER